LEAIAGIKVSVVRCLVARTFFRPEIITILELMEQREVAEKEVPETLWLREFRRTQRSEMAKASTKKISREKKVAALT
jgi:hypothetical protein